MKIIFRILIMIAVLFGILGLARNQKVWAANSSAGAGQSTLQLVGKSVSPSGDLDCKKDKNSEKCKDKEKDKCKKNKNDCGSVKPPPMHVVISATGEYSVGGFCTLSVTFNDPAIVLDASIEAPLPRELPDKVHKVRQGCHLIYYDSGTRIDDLPPASGTATICFAAMPRKQMTLYFNDIYSPHPKWVPLETTVQNGIACAEAPTSGVYVATFQKP